MSRVAVVGGANWDRTWRLPRLPSAGETVVGEGDPGGPGGKALNVAVGLARLGADVALVAMVGADAEGDAIRAALAAEGVDGAGVGVTAAAPTGTAAIWLAGSESTIAVAAGANTLLEAAAVGGGLSACGDGCELVVLQAEVGTAALEAAASWALARRGEAVPAPGRRPGPLLLLNPAPARPLPDGLWEAADVAVCNRAEAAALTGTDLDDPLAAEDAAVALCGRGPETAVVTLGADGAVVARRGRATYLPPFGVEVVDPTGAGDCTVAALARALIEGFDVFAATGYAMAAAAVCVGRRGAASAMPTLDEVDRIAHSVDLRRDPGMMPVRLLPDP